MDNRYNAASIAIHAEGWFLLIERARAPYQGYWTLPGGRLEPGESPEVGVTRELLEELGITVTPQFITSMRVGTGETRFNLAVFAGAYGHDQIRANDEILSWGWRSIAEAESLRTTPGLIDVLAQVSRRITRD